MGCANAAAARTVWFGASPTPGSPTLGDGRGAASATAAATAQRPPSTPYCPPTSRGPRPSPRGFGVCSRSVDGLFQIYSCRVAGRPEQARDNRHLTSRWVIKSNLAVRQASYNPLSVPRSDPHPSLSSAPDFTSMHVGKPQHTGRRSTRPVQSRAHQPLVSGTSFPGRFSLSYRGHLVGFPAPCDFPGVGRGYLPLNHGA